MTTGGSEGGDLVLHFRRSSQVRESEVLLLGPFAAPKPHAANLHLGFPPRTDQQQQAVSLKRLNYSSHAARLWAAEARIFARRVEWSEVPTEGASAEL